MPEVAQPCRTGVPAPPTCHNLLPTTLNWLHLPPLCLHVAMECQKVTLQGCSQLRLALVPKIPLACPLGVPAPPTLHTLLPSTLIWLHLTPCACVNCNPVPKGYPAGLFPAQSCPAAFSLPQGGPSPTNLSQPAANHTDPSPTPLVPACCNAMPKGYMQGGIVRGIQRIW